MAVMAGTVTAGTGQRPSSRPGAHIIFEPNRNRTIVGQLSHETARAPLSAIHGTGHGSRTFRLPLRHHPLGWRGYVCARAALRIRTMPIPIVRDVCVPSAMVTSDGLVEQVAQIDD